MIEKRQKDIDQLRRQLPLPRLLTDLIEAGRWVHPGEHVLRRKVPFITDPLDFLHSYECMLFNSGPLMGPNLPESMRFAEYLGSKCKHRDLPWIDVEKTIFIIINQHIGDDVGIALDYRTSITSPRIIGQDWHSPHPEHHCVYREISPSIESFVELIGL